MPHFIANFSAHRTDRLDVRAPVGGLRQAAIGSAA